MLPLKTTIEDLDALTAYLKTQVGWIQIDKVKKAIPSKHADNRKLEATRYVGLIDREGSTIKLTDPGRNYSSAANDAAKARILRHSPDPAIPPGRVDALQFEGLANYPATEVSCKVRRTDAAIFFLRLMPSKYIGAGNNRPETYLKVDTEALREYVTGEAATPETPSPRGPETAATETGPPSSLPVSGPVNVTSSPAVHINVEIHIAADAEPATIEEIFKNMRKYVLDLPPTVDE